MFNKYINTNPSLKLENGDEIEVVYPYTNRLKRRGIFKGTYKPDQYTTLLYIVQFYDSYNDNVEFVNPAHIETFALVRTLQQVSNDLKLDKLVKKITDIGDIKLIEQLNKILNDKELNTINKLNKISNIKLIKQE